MKNYALNETESANFITNFEIQDDQIIVYFGDGHNKIIKKSDEEIKRLLNTLEHQVKYSDKKKMSLYDHIRTLAKLAFYLLTASVVSICSLNYYGLNASLLFLIPAVTLAVISVKIYQDHSIIKDIIKHQTFLENKEKIIENIKNHPTVLMNTTELTQGIIDQERKHLKDFSDDEPINLNNLNDIPASDLNLILENIDSLESLGYASPEGEDRVIRFTPKKR